VRLLAVRLRKLAIDGEKTLQGTCVPAELPGVVLSAFEHRLDRTARIYFSFIGAPESDRLRRDTACREPSRWYTSALHRRGAAP
jgi:hypothetical protein